MTMHRLPCGVIYTDAFATHLAELQEEEDADRNGQILCLEYLRCVTGEKTGASWWKLEWAPRHRAPEDCLFAIGSVLVWLSLQTQRGLKHRCLDWRDGEVVIRS